LDNDSEAKIAGTNRDPVIGRAKKRQQSPTTHVYRSHTLVSTANSATMYTVSHKKELT